MSMQNTGLNLSYVNNVMQLGKSHKIYVNEDILDQEDRLVWEKGTRFTESHYDALRTIKLSRPLASSLAVEGGITTTKIKEAAHQICGDGHHLRVMTGKYFDEVLTHLITIDLSAPAALLLTLLQENRPYVFEHAVKVAIFSAAIGCHQKYGNGNIQQLIIAGLFIDIGELYVNTKGLDHDTLSPAEWKHIAVHPIVSKLVIESIAYPKSIALSVYEHHEKADGSGYPRGVTEQGMSPGGKVLSFAHTIVNALNSKTLPIIRATMSVKLIPEEFSKEVIKAMEEIRRLSSGLLMDDICEVSMSPQQLIARTKNIGTRLAQAESTCANLDTSNMQEKAVMHLSKIVGRLALIRKSLNAMGMGDCFSDAYLDRLSAADQDDTCMELDVISAGIMYRLRDIARETQLKIELFNECDAEAYAELILLLHGDDIWYE